VARLGPLRPRPYIRGSLAVGTGASLRPNSARVQHTQGTALAWLGRVKEAISFLSRATALDPSLESTRLNPRQALSDIGRRERAEEVFRDILRCNRGSIETHVGLGELIARRGNLAAASQHLQQALLLQPGYPARPIECGGSEVTDSPDASSSPTTTRIPRGLTPTRLDFPTRK
jgi:tetratricopeptide (TPR) repeat protein